MTSIDKKRICFVTENAMGGIPSAIKGIIASLDSSLFDFHMVLLDYSWRPVSDTSELFVPICDTSVYNINNINNRYHTLKKIYTECYSKADLIVAAMHYDVLANFITNKPKPIVLMVHSDTINEKNNVINFNDYLNYFIPISQKIQNSIDKWLPGTRKNIYLPHAIPELDLPFANQYSDDFTVVFVGRFNTTKGSDLLIQIGNYLKIQDNNIKYVIISDGVNEDSFKKEWANNTKTTYYNNISTEKVQEIMSKCNVLVMPSRSEGLPVVLIEAYRRGIVPVVSNLEGGIQEVVIDQVNGFSFQHSDTKKFANKIIELKNNRDLLNQLSEKGKYLINKKFNSKKNGINYQNLFLTAISHPTNKKVPLNVSNYLGALDKKYIPDFVTVVIRKLTKILK